METPSQYLSKRYVGRDKPVVDYHVQPKDKYEYQRRKAALKLNRDEVTLNDYPDYDTRLDIPYDDMREGDPDGKH